jgi:hypothetical protein
VSHFRRSLAVCFTVTALLAPRRAHAQHTIHHDVLRGTVTSDSGKAIGGADVIATMAPDRESRMTKTDAEGRYSIEFEHGTGDYLLHVSATGWQTFRKRITRTGSDSVFVTDVTLKSAAASGAQQLEAVKVSATKPKPDRETARYTTETGAAESMVGGVKGAVPPDQAGDLAAMAATIPGVAVTPGGITVGGVSPGQNSTTLNGASFAGADIPRDAQTTTRISSSTFDPARGWFAGVNTDVGLSIGNVFSHRQAHLTLDAPPLQYTDPVSASMGQRFTGIRGGIGGDGSMLNDRYAYNFGIDASRRSSDFVSVGSAPPDLLQRAGVSADSVARLSALLNTAGVPMRTSLVPSGRVSQSASLIGRIDRAPYNWNTFKPAPTTIGLLGYLKLANSGAVGTTPTATAAHAGETSQQIGMLQALFSSYWHDGYLTDAKSSISVSHNRGTPYLQLPNGQVLVSSTFADGTGGLTPLAFGGNGSLFSDTRQYTWETTTATQFYARGRQPHRVQLSADVRLDGIRQETNADRFGTYSYNSLADLAANRPASFTRTLNNPARTGAVWNGFVALGDQWRKSPSFQLLYGARLEGNRYLDVPANNPAVESAFGVRTDNAPNSIHVSPRLGFTWVRKGDRGGGIMFNPIGVFTMSPTSYIRGGIGEFRSFLGPDLLTGASVATGLPNGVVSLACVGSATPTPDWTQYAQDPSMIPQTCANGAQTPAFADAAPVVQTFDRSYTAARSWRANLSYASSWHLLAYSIEGLYSLNLNQPGRTDLNFANTPRFTLSDEGRPVFVAPGSVVPGTGAVSTVDARRDVSFGHVVNNLSNLTSFGRQLTFTLAPDLTNSNRRLFSRMYFSLGYTLAGSRAQSSGFDGTTFGSPLERKWSRSDFDVRHQFVLTSGFAYKQMSLTMFGRLQSGLPFTPMVGGDVNGDGYANDRAFIFDPARASDPVFASAMRTLLSTSDARVRDCLTKQMGRGAARNSCEGPWTTTLNAQLNWNGMIKPLGRRATVSLALANPLGGLDQLLHGTDHLRGWGSPATPDPILYTPRGFDPATQRFQYAVNPRFGSTNPGNTLVRAPFRVTLDVSMDIGKSLPLQQIDRWLRPGRGGPGPKLSAADLKRRYTRNVPDLYKNILEESDSLLLTRDQVDALQKLDSAYVVRMDSLWTDLVTYLDALGPGYDTKAVLKRQEDATDAAWELSRQEAHKSLPTVLSPIQLKLLPWPAGMLYEAKAPVHIRVFTAGG